MEVCVLANTYRRNSKVIVHVTYGGTSSFILLLLSHCTLYETVVLHGVLVVAIL